MRYIMNKLNHAAILGAKGGKARSEAKTASSRANGAKGGRPLSLAAQRLAALKAAPPEMRAQTYDSWMEVASAAMVRREWRAWMGGKPAWA
jgi:hypothetical protein